MSVKPILNTNIVSRPSINRGKQTSTKNLARGTNDRQSIKPGLDYTKNFAITLKDVDMAVMSHVKDVMDIKIREAGEVLKIPVFYGNQERWANVRKNGVLRDRNGVIMLPLIVLRRTDISFNESMPYSYKHAINEDLVSVVRSKIWSADNRYDRFSVQYGKQPVYEQITTTMPDFVNCTYSFVALTNYIEQMNIINEAFVHHSNTYWGSAFGYKFNAKIDTFTDASEMTVDGERLIKTEFDVVVNGYLLPETISTTAMGKVANMKVNNTPGKVIFGFEGDATAEQVSKVLGK